MKRAPASRGATQRTEPSAPAAKSFYDTPIMVLDPTTGDEVSNVDQVASGAVSVGIGAPPTEADGLEL